MTRVTKVWIRDLLWRSLLIQTVSLSIVVFVDGIEQSVMGGWSGWTYEVFKLHLIGLPLFVAMAVVWTERDWRTGGEWVAMAICGYSKTRLVFATFIWGAIWSFCWLGADIAMDEGGREAVHRVRTESLGEDWFIRDEQGSLPPLRIRVQGALVTEVSEGKRHFGQTSEGRWRGGEEWQELGEPSSVGSGVSTASLLSALFRGLSVALLGAICLCLSAVPIWLTLAAVAATCLFEVGVHSAVVRGFWSPNYFGMVPSILSLLLLWTWRWRS